MKKFLLISFLALLACSCVRITKFDAPDNYEFWQYEKKVDGKKLYGIVFDRHIKFKIGNYGVLKEEPVRFPYSIGGIPCLYDSISFEKICDKEYMFVCKKDEETYYYSSGGNVWAHEKPVTKIEYMSDSNKNMCFGYTHDFKFYTQDGMYTKCTGPNEDICVNLLGYAVKKNGKWGYFRHLKFLEKKENEDSYRQIVPCEYDEIIDMFDLSETQNSTAFARKGSTWDCYDNNGNKIVPKKDWFNQAMQAKKKNKNTNRASYCFWHK